MRPEGGSGKGGRAGVGGRPGTARRTLDRRAAWAVLFVALLVWSFLHGDVLAGERVNEGGWPLFVRFFRAALGPELSGSFLRTALDASLVTLGFAVLGTALSLVIGTVGGLIGSETWWRVVFSRRGGRRVHRAPWAAARAALAVPRSVHEIVWGVLLVNLVGLDPLVGVLAIGIPYGAIVAKVFSEILDETDPAALHALRNAGVRPLKAFLYGQVPRALRDLVSYAFYRFECSIRSAAVLGIIGAGGLGYQIFLSLQSLRYGEVWTFLYALLLLTGLTDLWSGIVRRRMASPHRVQLLVGGAEAAGTSVDGTEEQAEPEEPPARDPVVRWTLAGMVVLVVCSLFYLDAEWARLWSDRTLRLTADFARQAWPPTTGLAGMGELIRLSADTLAMSVLAMVFAGGLGVLFSFVAASNTLLPGGLFLPAGSGPARSAAGTLVFAASRGLLLFLRAVPAPIWALILLFVLFPGVLPGALALGLYTTGVLGRLMAEVVENLDARPLRALRAQGSSSLQVLLYGVLPATLPKFLSYLFYRWEVAIRATAMVGVVGAGGLGVLLTEQMGSFDFAAVGGTLLFYVGLTLLVDLLSALVRRDLR